MDKPLTFINIREVWPIVRAGLEDIRNRFPTTRWVPEDIYADCVNGNASLWFEDGSFLVLKSYIDELTLNRVLYVWIAYGKDLLSRQEQLDAHARAEGFDEIRLTSPRQGWAGVEGWRFMDATYSRKL